MCNFVSFDDGLSYIAVSEILTFGLSGDEGIGDRYTLFKMRDGSNRQTSRPKSEVATMLGSVNVWY